VKMLAALLWAVIRPVPGEADAKRTVRQHVRALKARGGGGVSFDCDGYRVEIYAPGTNMHGPWPM